MNSMGNFAYEALADGTVAITGYHGMEADVVIPQQIGGQAVSEIGECAFSGCGTLRSVVIPGCVKQVRECAFDRCGQLQRVVIQADPAGGLRDIWEDAFRDCAALEDIQLPEGLVGIGGQAFAGCVSLKRVTLPRSLQFIDDGIFCGCSGLEEVVILEGLEAIKCDMFSGCGNLRSVTIPDSVFMLQSYAFSGCRSLKRIVLSNELTQIRGNPFVDCGVEEFVVSPDHPTLAVVDGVLYEREDRRLICYPAARQEERFTIPEGTRVVDEAAFRGCGRLKQVTIPASVERIGNWAFGECDQLTCIVDPGTRAERWCRERGMRYMHPEEAGAAQE